MRMLKTFEELSRIITGAKYFSLAGILDKIYKVYKKWKENDKNKKN